MIAGHTVVDARCLADGGGNRLTVLTVSMMILSGSSLSTSASRSAWMVLGLAMAALSTGVAAATRHLISATSPGVISSCSER